MEHGDLGCNHSVFKRATGPISGEYLHSLQARDQAIETTRLGAGDLGESLK